MTAPDVATCGTCGRSWDFSAYPTPASLCPFCNGDERAAAPHEVGPPVLTDEPGKITKLTGPGSVHRPHPDDVPHAGWCRDHRTEDDGHEVIEVCRRSVTFGEVTVELEDCPAWPDDERHQVVPPDLAWCDVEGAKDFAAALVEAARIIEDAR